MFSEDLIPTFAQHSTLDAKYWFARYAVFATTTPGRLSQPTRMKEGLKKRVSSGRNHTTETGG